MGEKIQNTDLNNNFSSEINKIFEIFNNVEADSIRLVGGCVRDLLLEIEVNDFDFATRFLPEETIKILEDNGLRAIPTGLKYGTITALIGDKSFEITTLRKDVENDGRYPRAEFIDDYFFDAKRRDFTVNALYLDQDGQVFDYFSGIEDLKERKICFIGDSNERIQEDYLRILRFFRFSIFYAQNIDEDGLKYCVENKKGIEILSGDRIRNEFMKFFVRKSNNLLSFIEIFDREIGDEIFDFGLKINNLRSLIEIENKFNLDFNQNIKFGSLIFDNQDFGDIFREKLDKILIRMNFSNEDKKYFRFLNEYFEFDKDILWFLANFEKNYVRDLFILKNLNSSDKLEELINFINNFELPDFVINGEDVMNLGFSGEEIGVILKKAKEIWIESEFKASKDEIISRLVGG